MHHWQHKSNATVQNIITMFNVAVSIEQLELHVSVKKAFNNNLLKKTFVAKTPSSADCYIESLNGIPLCDCSEHGI